MPDSEKGYGALVVFSSCSPRMPSHPSKTEQSSSSAPNHSVLRLPNLPYSFNLFLPVYSLKISPGHRSFLSELYFKESFVRPFLIFCQSLIS